MSRILVAARPDLLNENCLVLLEAKGYQVLQSATLQDGLAVILEDPPDLLIVEWGLWGESFWELIKVASGCLQKSNMPILMAVPEEILMSLDWERIPVDDVLIEPVSPEKILTRLVLAESRSCRVFDNNPLSKLPGNTSILKAVQRRLDGGDCWGVCYLDIDNFKPYNDRYGFSQGDDVILMVARLIVNVIDDLAREGSFVGHVGGDDFVFIVPSDKVDGVCSRLIQHFNVVRNMFLSSEDQAVGAFVGKDRQGRETRYDLLSISIAVVMIGPDFGFSHFGEVAATSAQVKHFVKEKTGSNYSRSRYRRSTVENLDQLTAPPLSAQM